MRVIIDAMGGDNAPQAPVLGAVRAKKELGVDVTLVGRREEIARYLGKEKGIDIVDAREIITMEDDPSTATRRKKDSSMAVALTMLKEGKGDAVISAGSTGALLTGAHRLRRECGVHLGVPAAIRVHGQLLHEKHHGHPEPEGGPAQ